MIRLPSGLTRTGEYKGLMPFQMTGVASDGDLWTSRRLANSVKTLTLGDSAGSSDWHLVIHHFLSNLSSVLKSPIQRSILSNPSSNHPASFGSLGCTTTSREGNRSTPRSSRTDSTNDTDIPHSTDSSGALGSWRNSNLEGEIGHDGFRLAISTRNIEYHVDILESIEIGSS